MTSAPDAELLPGDGQETAGEEKIGSRFRIEQVFMAAGMAAMALISGANALTRYVTNASLAFTEDFTVIIMVAVTLLGGATAVARNRHIAVLFFVQMLSPFGRRIAGIVAMVLLIACFGVVIVYGFKLTYEEYRYDTLTPSMELPQWWFTSILPVLSLLVVYRAVGKIVTLARNEADVG